MDKSSTPLTPKAAKIIAIAREAVAAVAVVAAEVAVAVAMVAAVAVAAAVDAVAMVAVVAANEAVVAVAAEEVAAVAAVAPTKTITIHSTVDPSGTCLGSVLISFELAVAREATIVSMLTFPSMLLKSTLPPRRSNRKAMERERVKLTKLAQIKKPAGSGSQRACARSASPRKAVPTTTRLLLSQLLTRRRKKGALSPTTWCVKHTPPYMDHRQHNWFMESESTREKPNAPRSKTCDVMASAFQDPQPKGP